LTFVTCTVTVPAVVSVDTTVPLNTAFLGLAWPLA
jgi:hypothetical protein